MTDYTPPIPKTYYRIRDMACSLLLACSIAHADSTSAPRVVSAVENTFTRLPGRHWGATSAPLMGNGDMGVCLLGSSDSLVFMLGKNDFWHLKNLFSNSSALGFGFLNVKMPALKGAAMKLTQHPADAMTRGTLSIKDGASLCITTYVAATEDVLVICLEAQGKPLPVELDMRPDAFSFKQESGAGDDQGILWATRHFTENVDLSTGASAALKVVGARGATFTLQPGKPVTLLLAMASNFDARDHLSAAKQSAQRADAGKLSASHRAWWTEFWGQSLVEVDDPELMRRYYTAQYVMGSASRNPDFPPGIVGPWITVNNKMPFACGAYWMNYNHAAPYYGLYSSNHLEQADPQDTPILQFMERGREYARDILHIRGLLYPVGIGPLGFDMCYKANSSHSKRYVYPNVEGGVAMTWGQRSNAAYNLVNMGQRWYTTYDPTYGKKIYPYMRGVVDFWEDYLTLEGDRYVINDESVHEGSAGNKNPISSLGFVRNAFRLALDMSAELGVDQDRRAKWQDILARLSDYPTKDHNGKEIFILSEEGPVLWKSNTVHIQHIYPAGQIGLDSDPKLLQIARDTLEAVPRWYDGNGSNSFFPMAARIGYDPSALLANLRRYPMGPNGFFAGNPHGIENCSTVPNTVNEMLLQSHEGVLRFFPCWPKDQDARFGTLRAYGAFLVSAELKSGVVTGVKITSEKGRDCTVQNPWPGKKVQLAGRETIGGDRFTFKTKLGEIVEIKPQG